MAKQFDDFRDNFFRKACSEDNLSLVKKLIGNDISSQLNLKDGLITAGVNGSISVVKYLLETPDVREKIDLDAPYIIEDNSPSLAERLLVDSYFNSRPEVVDYLLFNMNINVSDNTKDALRINGTFDLLNKIEKRDLFYKLNEDMSINEENKKKPKTKV